MSAELTSKYGFSVVAPTSVTVPSSTAGSSASCWALLKRWISSRKKIVARPPRRRSSARAITSRTSARPAFTAERSSNAASACSAVIRASVVLPVPGGPNRIMECGRPDSIAVRSAEPSPRRCSWPANSSRVRGRIRAASGPSSGTGSGPGSSGSNKVSTLAPYPAAMDLQAEAVEVLSRLIRFDTVNPPGNERACQEWLKRYLEDAGLECELLHDGDPERPNLVARLRGEADGPVLGYLSHVDTVLADAADWRHDPWSGEVHDGAIWGRGAIDMKSQTAAEAVALARLARAGWRPPRGEVKLISVVDEETGGAHGAQWLTEQRPDAVRVDWLLNEGGGAVMPYGERRLYGVCCAEKGTFRFQVRARGRAGHASVPALADNALLKLLPALERFGTGHAAYDVVDEPRALLAALGEDPADPAGAIASIRATEPTLAALVEPTLGATFAPTIISAGSKINVIPAHAEFAVDCRLPPGLGDDVALARATELLGDARDGLELDWTEAIVGNRSPLASPLMDSADERLDVRDLGFATECFADLPRRLLT